MADDTRPHEKLAADVWQMIRALADPEVGTSMVLKRDDDFHAAALNLIEMACDSAVAAVRAEKGVERFVDGILDAAVRAEHRLTVVKLRDDEASPVAAPCAIKGACQYERSLTDAEVDAFLTATIDRDDPERVERIRKLLDDKLDADEDRMAKRIEPYAVEQWFCDCGARNYADGAPTCWKCKAAKR